MMIVLALLLQVAVIQANSPEDFWREGRTRAERIAEVAELRAMGANERFGILHTIGGDTGNSTPFVAGWQVDHAWIEEVAGTVREGNALGMAFEIALFEEENANAVPNWARVDLADACARALRGLDVIICLSEENPLPGWASIELVAQLRAADPEVRISVHNGVRPGEEEAHLGAVAGLGLIASGQIENAGQAGRFVQQWADEFAGVRIVEVGPYWKGFEPWGDYAEQRKAVYTALMGGEGIGIYYGVQFDRSSNAASHEPWREAYRQAVLAVMLTAAEGGCPTRVYRPDLALGDPCVVEVDEAGVPRTWRVYMDDGDGWLALPAGWYVSRRFDPAGDGSEVVGEREVFWHGAGVREFVRLSGPVRRDRLIVVRTLQADAVAVVLGRALPLEGWMYDAATVVGTARD